MGRTKNAGSAMVVLAALVTLGALMSPTATAAPVKPPPTPQGGEERWRITGQPVADGCGGQIVLAVRHLRFSGHTMFGDVVNRRYRYERQGNRRVAEGQFTASYACAGTELYERWELRHQSEDVLVGELTSTWQLEPTCEPCTIRFDVRAVRLH